MNLEQVRRDYEREHCPAGAEIRWDKHGRPWIHDGRGMPFPVPNSWDLWLAATRAALGWCHGHVQAHAEYVGSKAPRKCIAAKLAGDIEQALAALGGDE